MTHDEAIALISELVRAEVELMKQDYSRLRGASKNAHRREQAAVFALFAALTGEKPTTPEIAEMVIL